MSIVFYWHPMSNATPVASALAELDIPHQRIKVDIKAGEQRRPEFLALNPNGKVPTLTVDGAPMFETLAIQLWLGERYGVERGLWPAADTPERLLAMSWCAWSYVSYGAVVSRLHLATHPADAPDSAGVENVLGHADALLAVLDGHLARRPWMLGAAYSLADLVVGAVIGYSVHLGARVASHPHVRAWLDRVQARPAMQIDA